MIYSSDYTVDAASLTGFASNVTGAAWTITTAGPADGMQHLVTVRNDSVTDHSAKTIILVGTDANGNSQTETIAAPGTSATVTSTKEFRTLVSATPSATIGADTFDIGWTAVASGPWVVADFPGQYVGVGVHVGGTINYDVEILMKKSTLGTATAYKAANITAKTAKAYDFLAGPIHAFRLHVNSHTSGVIHLESIQAGQ